MKAYLVCLFWTWAPGWVRRALCARTPICTGWKCVTANMRSTSAMFPVCYRPYKWAVPRAGDGPLCVFATRSAAHRYAVGFGDSKAPFQVVACYYVPSSRRALRQIGWASTTLLLRDTALAEGVKLSWNLREDGNLARI